MTADLRVVDMSDMRIIADEHFTDTELLRLLTNDGIFDDAVESGLEYEFTIRQIADRDEFVNALFEAYGPYNKSFDLEKVEPTRRNSIAKGHPDYVVEYVGDGETSHKDDRVFIEMKYGDDGLRSSQVNWILEHIQEGYDVWVVWADLEV